MSQPLDVPASGFCSDTIGPIPDYMRVHYWWAYIHPVAVRLFERTWLVNLLLWFNYRRLGDAALAALGELLPGRTLQIGCVYGDLTERLARRCRQGDGQGGGQCGGGLDVVDVLSVQLANLARKLPTDAPARLLTRDASALALPDASYDRALLFFLLHEQPDAVRRLTLREALQVVRPGGSVVVVDYAQPAAWHLARYLWLPLLRVLEPFARDFWRKDIAVWLPEPWSGAELGRAGFCGGLYQLVTIKR